MPSRLIGLIPAAGKGERLYPDSKEIPKVLLEVDGISTLQRNIEIMRNDLGIKTVFIIVGPNKSPIVNIFGDGSKFGVNIEYIFNENPERGLADGILQAREFIQSTFCVILGDELYLGSNHKGLARNMKKGCIAICGVMKTNSPAIIKKNYSVEISRNRITSLIEKPDTVKNNFLGCGTYIFQPEIYDFIERTPNSAKSGKKEITDSINLAASSGKTVMPFFLTGEYVNINTIGDFNRASYITRNKLLAQKRISLVIPAYNEAESIGDVIDDFKGSVNEIIVADNMSGDSTAEIAKRHGAIVISKRYKGYGDALRHGMDNATGDILVLTEADGSFRSGDLVKILEYLKDADVVMGTRTVKQAIDESANMNLAIRIGNIAVAKIIELLWWGRHCPRLSDVGCTYRGIWRDAYQRIRTGLTSGGPGFSPEMIIESINHKLRLIEVPVFYYGRIGGESKFSGSFLSLIKTGLKMIFLIIKKRMNYSRYFL